MRGVFTTMKYACRSDLEREAPYAVDIAENGYTEVGVRWMWDMMAGNHRKSDGTLNDHLGAARLVVGNSSQQYSFGDTRLAGDTAQAALDEGFPAVGIDGTSGTLTLQATFGEQEASFDWQERGVLTAQGVLLDRAVKDGGRKVLGAIWVCRAVLYLDSVGEPAPVQ